MNKDHRHWLYRPENLPRLWKWGGVVLALSVAAEFFVSLHAGFGLADWFGFNAVYGFFSCLVMVVFAKWLGAWVKRPEDYFESAEDAPDGGPARAHRDPSRERRP